MSVPRPAPEDEVRPPPAVADGVVARTRAAARGLWSLVGAVVSRVQNHGQTGRAGQFAYNAFLATIPFLFILVSLIGLVGSPTTYDDLIDELGDAIPADMVGFLKSALGEAASNTQQATLFLIFGLVTGLWITGNVIGALGQALDAAYEVDGRPWVRGKLAQLAFAGAACVLAVVAAVALVGGPQLADDLVRELGGGSGWATAAKQLVVVIGVAIFAGVIMLLYRFLPNVPGLRFRSVIAGTAVATGGWLGATWLFRIYVDGFGSYNKVYGSLGAVVIYMVFLYITGLVLMIGGEVNAELRARRRARAVAG